MTLRDWLLAILIVAAMSLSVGCGQEPVCNDGEARCEGPGFSVCQDGDWTLVLPGICPVVREEGTP